VHLEPLADVETGQPIEVQFMAGSVEGQPAIDGQLLPIVERDVEAPDDAFAMKPCVVEPDLAARIRLSRLEVVDAEQHAEMELQRGERADGQQPAFLSLAGELARGFVDNRGGHRLIS
jgi:hypothetical protein